MSNRIARPPTLRYFAAIAALAMPTLTLAAPGDLDTSFGGTGVVITEFGNLKDGNNSAAVMLVQTDNKIVISGSTTNSTNDDISLIRYNTNGSIDTTFDLDGRVNTSIGNSSDTAYGMVQQADGKLLVAGSAQIRRANGSTDWDFFVVRYNSNGSLDTDFGTLGKVLTTVGTTDDIARSVALQADGKIVVAGYATVGAGDDFAVVRYNSDGSLDTAFDGDGKLTTPVLSAGDRAYSVAIQSDDKIVVAGDTELANQLDIALVRYNSNGSLDTSFDGDGKLTKAIGQNILEIPPTEEDDKVRKVVIQPDGAIVVAGASGSGTFTDFMTARFTSTGAIDTTFGVNGVQVTSTSAQNDGAEHILIQSDGKLFVTGTGSNGSNNDFASVRLTANGSLDTTFSTDGIQLNAVGTSVDSSFAAAQQPSDNKLLLAGVSSYGTNPAQNDTSMIRLNLDGTLDTTFDGDGRLNTTAGTTINTITAAAPMANGKTVAVGTAHITTTNVDFALAVYSSDGTLDTTFSGDGLHSVPFTSFSDTATSVVVQTDGKIVLAGYRANAASNDIALARLLTTGVLDTTYASSGKYTTAISSTFHDAINGIIQLKNSGSQNGKLLATGYINSSADSASSDFALMRFHGTTGFRDNTFDSDGNLVTQIGLGKDIAYDLVEQTDGKIVVVGESLGEESGNNDSAVARYNIDGTLDTSFDLDGKLTFNLNNNNDFAKKVALQADGKILITGETTLATQDVYVTRLNTDGSLDTGFGTNGYVFTGVGSDDSPSGIVVEPNGKIVISGTATSNPSNFAFILRYNSNGTLDSSFGAGGKAIIDTANHDSAQGLAIHPNGKYTIAGNTAGPGKFLAARVQVTDLDADGFSDGYDNCPANANAGQEDFDGDKIGDVCDADADGDGVADNIDNCLMLANPTQLDTDSDSIGNDCDDDDDGDGTLDINDAFPLDLTEWLDTDSDGIGNNADGDDDGDGAADAVDVDPLNPAIATEITLPINSNFDGSSLKDSQKVQ